MPSGPAPRRPQSDAVAIVRRLAVHLQLLADAAAELADVDLKALPRSRRLARSIQRALALDVVTDQRKKRAQPKLKRNPRR